MQKAFSSLSGQEQREVLKLGPPAAGEVLITVDPSRAGTSFAAGTQALVSRAEIPVHRHLDRDEMLFVYKGQGRAILGAQTIIVVPGVTFHVPRGTWFGLRNTGTGALQFVWVSSPGLEAFFRDLSRFGATPSPQAVQELAQRHRIEFRPASEPVPAAAPASAGHRRRRRRGGRRHHARGGGRQSSDRRHVLASGESAGSVAGHRQQASGTPAVPTSAPPGKSAPSPAQGAPRPAAGRPKPPSSALGASERRPRGRHRRKIKEVYMGGRWIQVEGEGPVIAPGRGGPQRRAPKRDDDDDSPSTPLSVPL